MQSIKFGIFLCTFFFYQFINAQAPQPVTSSDIHNQIEKLNVLGSVLYVAAHPDDENTRLISYFSNARNMETTYLSLTRGDGGQNLIGPEISELLGVIRTQELLAARRIDGGKQLFSRANDFGYSKSPLETMEIWNKDAVLSDVVFAIRKVQPDIIINRFSNDINSTTHGHHTASAVLSTEAYELTNDETKYPEQLDYVTPWRAQRLFFNTSWWFYGSREAFENADKSNMLSVDAGVYYPRKGKSNGEIASESRSMHKCQGMGATNVRGQQEEYLELLEGKKLNNAQDPFDGIDITWSRLKNGAHITNMVTEVSNKYEFDHPEKSINGLLAIRDEIIKLETSKWQKIKLAEVDEIIFNCAGFYTEAIASDFEAAPGQALEVQIEFTNRLADNMRVNHIKILPAGEILDSTFTLHKNENIMQTIPLIIPKEAKFTNAYWLEKEPTLGMYQVTDQALRGLPEAQKMINAEITIEINGNTMLLVVPIQYKKTDPVKAEVYRPLEIIPAAVVNPTEQVYVFAEGFTKEVKVLVKAGIENMTGRVMLTASNGNWKIEPTFIDISTTIKGEERIVTFNVKPLSDQDEATIHASINVGDRMYTQKKTTIEYDHIPAQMVLSDAKAKVVKINLQKRGDLIGYIEGAGDEIPASLKQIGYTVEIINPDNISANNLQKYNAVILGVRAFNTVDRLKFKKSALFEYAQKGGNVIVQYNTNRRLVTDEIAPYKLELGRGRVTVEGAPIRMLAADHPVLNTPNKITQNDFEGWVQERGLYFADEWADEFVPILSSNDPGEEPLNGGLLIAPYGDGFFTYTGYSWFRELPAGVPGAYRLFTNIISLGKANKS